jgi:hypothetical protein
MLCSDSASGMTPERQDAVIDGCGGWTEEMLRRGVVTAAIGLASAATGRSVRVRGGEVLLGDGPFAETKDQVGGFTVVECADLDEALALAAEHPWAGQGQVEVRPLREPEP